MTIRMLLLLGLVAGSSFGPAHAAPAQTGVQTAHPLPNPAGLGFYEYLPAGYASGVKFPLIVFFHGQGERGNGASELSRVLKNGPPKLINAGSDFPAIVISPQLPASNSSWSDTITTPFVDYLLAHYAVDPTRIYVTGLSLGGGGAWRYAKAHPNLVAAVVPVCGTESSSGYAVLADVPIWAFHSEGDPTVPLNSSTAKLEVITGIAPLANRPDDNYTPGYTGSFVSGSWHWRRGYETLPPGGNPHFTVFESTSHDAWTRTYADQAMWDWLFAQKRTSRFKINLPVVRK